MLRVLIVILIVSTSALTADTLQVPGVYQTIQEAIDAAQHGDTVLVAWGVYVENIKFPGGSKTITVKSELGPKVTYIEGDQTEPVVTLLHSSTSILDGFTVRNGDSMHGGGIFCDNHSTGVIRNNIITGNHASNGGGLYCRLGSAPTIENNLFIQNSASYGGGISCTWDTKPVIRYNRFEENGAGKGAGIELVSSNKALIEYNEFINNIATSWGGGINDSSTAIIRKNLFQGNEAKYGAGVCCDLRTLSIEDNRFIKNKAEKGGAIYCYNSASPMVSGNIIVENEADYGAGIYLASSLPVIRNCHISRNWTWEEGAGIYLTYSAPTIENTVFYWNIAGTNGGGIYGMESTANVVNCSFSRSWASKGGCIACTQNSQMTVTNTIMWYDDKAIWVGDAANPSTLTISYSNVWYGKLNTEVDPGCTLEWDDNSMIDAEPMFLDDIDAEDFHITYDSPCRDTGTNAAPGMPEEDFDGNPRVAYGVADMGADEFHTHFYYTGDAVPAGHVKGHFVGLPGETLWGLAIGAGVLDPPLATVYGDWYLLPPWTLVGPIGQIDATGYRLIEAILPPLPFAPYDLPMQALIGNELTDLLVMEVR